MTPLENPSFYESAAVAGLYQGAVIGLFILTLGAILAVLVAFGIEAADDRIKRFKARKG